MLYIIFETKDKYHITEITEAFLASNTYFTECFHVAPLKEGIDYDTIDTYDISINDEKEITYSKKVKSFAVLQSEKIGEAVAYGNSPAVDACLIGGTELVINAALRGKLNERFSVLQKRGIVNDTIIFGSLSIEKPITELQGMLQQIAYRAIENFDILQGHIQNLERITNANALKEYDFKAHYKAKLIF